MEDFKIDILIESGPNARNVQIGLNPFTLVGATTRSGLLTAPLRSRFGINMRLNYYDTATLGKIITRSAGILHININADAAHEIARRSRGTPRIANLLLRRVRDFAQIKGNGNITLEIARYGLQALNVDEHGLDEMDNRILTCIISKFKGGPVGLNTIATAVGEDAGTIEEVYEPFLIQEGFLVRTPRGREVTPIAYKHLNFTNAKADKVAIVLFIAFVMWYYDFFNKPDLENFNLKEQLPAPQNEIVVRNRDIADAIKHQQKISADFNRMYNELKGWKKIIDIRI